MKFLATTDTHYGHGKNTHIIHTKFLKRVAEEVKRENIRAVIHAGDWVSHKQDQFPRTLKMFRKFLGDTPIATVRGNHSFWEYNKKFYHDQTKEIGMPMWGELDRKHKEWFKEFNITHLEDEPVVIDDVIIVGFDGWYNLSFPPTNDKYFIRNNIEGVWFHTWLANRAYKQMEKLLLTDYSKYRAAICVTHFPPFTEDPAYVDFCANPNYLEFLTETFDVLCVGHSHKYCDTVINGCRVINPGSHYDMPQAKIFEV